ncbi:MAG: hypothetical protein QM769_02740 [Pseudoxanthomonas sp.]
MKKPVVALLALLGALLITPTTHAAMTLPWADAEQMVVVVVPDWNASTGTLRRYERARDNWRLADYETDIVIGRNGAAWGLGLHPQQADGPQKVEGDGRAPAGVFALGDAFGYADKVKTKMPYLALTPSQYCIDVEGSPLYNQIVDADQVGAAAVRGSTEPMRRDLYAGGDEAYREGFVIRQNPGNASGKGSCVFAHLWQSPTTPTAGCTAMDDKTMERVLAWLNPKKNPVFVLLPRAEYDRLRREWSLP